MTQIDFIAVDWGTSSFRAWAINRAGKVLAQQTSDQGMGALTPADFSSVLEAALARMNVGPSVPVIACGMVGAAQGWVEAPYVPSDNALDRLQRNAAKAPGTARDVFILPGVKQTRPPNVMRGEETQIAGFLQSNPGFAGVICLPGTHAKWVQVADGSIRHFVSAMTGEMFGLISGQSVLRHSMGAGGWDDAIFNAAVDAALATPASVATQLFEIRADGLLNGPNAGKARAWLSGLLVGLELAATKDLWAGQTVHLIGAPDLTKTYARALARAGAAAERHDATRLTLAGLTAAATDLLGQTA